MGVQGHYNLNWQKSKGPQPRGASEPAYGPVKSSTYFRYRCLRQDFARFEAELGSEKALDLETQCRKLLLANLYANPHWWAVDPNSVIMGEGGFPSMLSTAMGYAMLAPKISEGFAEYLSFLGRTYGKRKTDLNNRSYNLDTIIAYSAESEESVPDRIFEVISKEDNYPSEETREGSSVGSSLGTLPAPQGGGEPFMGYDVAHIKLFERLSKRQMRILECYANTYSVAETAELLNIDQDIVDREMKAIRSKGAYYLRLLAEGKTYVL